MKEKDDENILDKGIVIMKKEKETDLENDLEQIVENKFDSDLETIDNIKRFLEQTKKSPVVNLFFEKSTDEKILVDLCPEMIKNDVSPAEDTETDGIITEDFIKAESETITIVYDGEEEMKEFKIIIEPDHEKEKAISSDIIEIKNAEMIDTAQSVDIKDNFKCVRCFMSFECLKELGVHYRSEHYKKRRTIWQSKFGRRKSNVKRRKTLALMKKKQRTSFRCNKCLVFFGSYKKLLQHRESFEHNRVTMCDICNKTFKYKYLLRLHMKTHRTDDQRLLANYRCISCQKDFNTFHKIIVHYGEVHDGQVRCILCDKIVRKGLKAHMKTHRKRLYKCLPCDRVFNTNNELKAHYHSPEHIEVKTCKICNKVFENPARKRLHMSSMHEERKEKMHLCEYCGLTFSGRATLNIHKVRQHNVGERMVLCELCGMVLGSRTSLRNHMEYEHTNNGKKLKQWKSKYSTAVKARRRLVRNPQERELLNGAHEVCYICVRPFPVTLLNSHHKSHLNHQALENITRTCTVCDLTIDSEREYFNHMLKQHQQFSCYKCHRMYTKKSAVRNHMRAHQDSENIQMHTESVECLTCHMTFKYKSSLKYHMYTHTGEKPYECKVCGKLFRKPYHVKLHMKTHSEEPLYKCDICDNAYSSKNNLKQHLDEKHFDNVHCSKCNKTYISQKGLEGHIARMHTNSNQNENVIKQGGTKTSYNSSKTKEYKCEFCIRVFKSEIACLNHTKRFHPQKAADLEEMDIKDILDPRRKDCYYCHRYFKSETAFENHLRKAHPQHFNREATENMAVYLTDQNSADDLFGEDSENTIEYEACIEDSESIEEVERSIEAEMMDINEQEHEFGEEDEHYIDSTEHVEIIIDESTGELLTKDGVVIEEYMEPSDE